MYESLSESCHQPPKIGGWAGRGTTESDEKEEGPSVGLAFRTLFSQPDATVLTRWLYSGANESRDERYWEAMLDHCIAGNLQAVMDEHVHVLRESLSMPNSTR